MFARVTTVAFEGIEARGVDVQVQIGPGVPAFTIVGLPDKAVAESRERVRGAQNQPGPQIMIVVKGRSIQERYSACVTRRLNITTA